MSYANKAPIEVGSPTIPEASLGAYEPATPSIPAVILQTGYLIIRDFEEYERSGVYRLSSLSHEVEDGFNEWLVGQTLPQTKQAADENTATGPTLKFASAFTPSPGEQIRTK